MVVIGRLAILVTHSDTSNMLSSIAATTQKVENDSE